MKKENTVFQIRINSNDKEVIMEAAKIDGKSTAEFIKKTMISKSKRLIAKANKK